MTPPTGILAPITCSVCGGEVATERTSIDSPGRLHRAHQRCTACGHRQVVTVTLRPAEE